MKVLSLLLLLFLGLSSTSALPTLGSISPSNWPMGGGAVITFSGSGFGTDLSYYRYIQVGSAGNAFISASSFISLTDTEIVAYAPYGSYNTPISGLTVYLMYAEWDYDVFTNTVSYVYWAMTSVSPSTISLPGDRITITGTNFGINLSWWGYFQVGSITPPVYPSSWVSLTNTQIVLLAPSCGEYPIINQNLYLGFKGGAYGQLDSVLSYTYPTLSTLCHTYSVSMSPFNDICIIGGYFGYVGNTYWGNLVMPPGNIQTSTPAYSVSENVLCWDSILEFPSGTYYMHWSTNAYATVYWGGGIAPICP